MPRATSIVVDSQAKPLQPVDAQVRRKERRRLRLPCTRKSPNASSEIQLTSNGSDRPPTAEPASRRPQDVESARLKEEAADRRALRWMRRRKSCVNFWKRFIAFLLSTVGLTILMVFYTIFGGFVFSVLESPNEDRTRNGVRESLRWHVAMLWNLTEEMNVLFKDNWTAMAQEVVNNYTKQVFIATKVDGWDGKEDGEAQSQWTFAGSMLYSATVITTIGYGHIAPKTDFGRIATMLYALIGIPLTLLSITHMGGFMATVFRFLYKNIFCGLCCVLCRRRRYMDESLKTTVVKKRGGGGGKARTKAEAATAEVEAATAAAAAAAGEKTDPAGGGGGGVQDRLRRPYTIVVQWRRGIRNALFTEDNLMVHVPIYVSIVLICGYIALGAIMFGLWEKDWDFLVGSYFCFITLSTIGFGDFVPGTSLDPASSQEKHILCSLYLIFGLALLAMCFDLMQEEARSIFRNVGRKVGLISAEEQPPQVASLEAPGENTD